jgi:drug/metabolite transporter (DMT)-like permease
MLYIGEIAAIITSVTYAVNSALFTLAGREVGSIVVNRLRLVAASLLLMTAHWFFLGTPWPVRAEGFRWIWLGGSGIVGLVLGDAFLFQAFVMVGPRISMLMMSLAPILAAFSAWIFLGESLSVGQMLGIGITLIGVAWVVTERNGQIQSDPKNYIKGILFGLGAATGQALGLVFAKPGLVGGFSPISANFIRMFTAMILIWLIAFLQKKVKDTIRMAIANPSATWKIFGGAFSGPFIGVSLSLFALQRTSVGIASTLMALPPLFLLPIDYFYFKEDLGWSAIVGTVVALVGVGILFLA